MKTIWRFLFVTCLHFFAYNAYATECIIQNIEPDYTYNNEHRVVVFSDAMSPPKIRRSPITIETTGFKLNEDDLRSGSLPLIDTEMLRIADNVYEMIWKLELTWKASRRYNTSRESFTFDVYVTCDEKMIAF